MAAFSCARSVQPGKPAFAVFLAGRRRLIAIAALAALHGLGITGAKLLANPYTFDADGALPLSDGGGNWTSANPGDTSWSPDGATFGPWGNTTSDVATFGVGNGAAGTINVDTVNANGITFNSPGSGNYSLSGGTITLGGTTPTITANVDTNISSALAGTGGFTKAGAGTLTISGANTLTGATTINNGTLKLGATNALSTSTALTVSGVGAIATLDLGGFNQTAGAISIGGSSTTSGGQIVGSGTLTLGGSVTYVMANNPKGALISVTTLDLGGANRSFIVNASSSATPDMLISSVIQNGAFTKQNTGGLTLTGMNTFSGGIFIFNNNINVAIIGMKGQPGNLGNNDVISIGNTTNTAQFTYTGVGETTNRAIAVAGGAGGGSKIINNNTGGAGTPLKFTADLIITATGAKTFTLDGTGTGEFAGVIPNGTAAITVTKTNSGTWTLSNPNSSFTGGMNINQGILIATAIGNKGQNGNLGNVNTINIGNTTNGGQLTYNGAGETTDRTVNLGGTTGGAIIANNSTTNPLKFTSDMTATGVGNKTLTLQGSGDGEFAGKIVDSTGGITSLTKTGAGTWILSGINTYTGDTHDRNGVLVIPDNVTAGQPGPLGAATTAVTIGLETGSANANSPTLVTSGPFTVTRDIVASDLSTGTETLGGNHTTGTSTYTGNVTLGLTSNVGKNLSLTAATGGTVAFSGNILQNGTSAANITKIGGGTVVLSGANTYTGTTTVSAGSLLVNGTHLNAGPYVVSGGLLGGGGSITTNSANVTVSGGGSLAPGAPIGSLTMDLGAAALDVSAAAPGSLVFDLGTAASDRVILAGGTLNIGTLNFGEFSFVPQPDFGPGDYTLFQTSSAINGSIGSATGTVNGFDAQLEMVGNNLDLIVSAPEPTSTGLIALAAAGLLGRRRTRRSEWVLELRQT